LAWLFVQFYLISCTCLVFYQQSAQPTPNGNFTGQGQPEE